VGIFEFKWRRTVGSQAATTPALQARALDDFLDLLARVPNVVARKLYLREFSERLRIPEDDIERRMRELAGRARSSFVGHDRLAGAGEPRRAEAPGEAQAIGELAIECLLALPHLAGEIWTHVPPDVFAEPPLRDLAGAIDRRVAAGAFSAAGLLADLEEEAASRLLVKLLSRTEDRDGKPSRDYEQAWAGLRRDIERFQKRKRAAELKRRVATAAEEGGTESLDKLRREYFGALKELKKV
jgi:DNA primase